MSERTAEQEFEQVKGDVVNLLRALENSLKEKLFSTKVCEKTIVGSIKCHIAKHPKTCMLVAGTVVVGLGIFVSKMLKSND